MTSPQQSGIRMRAITDGLPKFQEFPTA